MRLPNGGISVIIRISKISGRTQERKISMDNMDKWMEKRLTRRQFVSLTGKSLAALAFWGSGAAVSASRAQAESGMISVNSLVTGAPEMRCVFLERLSTKKSDAFYVTTTDENGMELYLIDGGLATGKALLELLNLRKEILTKAGLQSEHKNDSYKLDVTLLISHFHSDHVRELSSGLIASRYLRINAVYMPAATALDQSGVYENGNNSDLDNRPSVLSALEKYQPQAETHVVEFGDVRAVPLNVGELTLYASPVDWGTSEYAEKVGKLYYAGNAAKRRTDTPVAVLNANCLWMRFSFAGHSILFTGDVMKKLETGNAEALDLFVQEYGEALRSDVVKFPHHGLSRDKACRPVRDSLMTNDEMAACVLTGNGAAEKIGALLSAMNVTWYDIESGSVVYALTEEGIALLSDHA